MEPCSECSIASVENCNCDLQDGGGGGELQTGNLVIVVIGGDDGSDGALVRIFLIFFIKARQSMEILNLFLEN